jgi:taurine dioxygenase
MTVTEFRTIEVTPSEGPCGATITGVELVTATDEQIAEIRQAFSDYSVLFFRDQQLTPDEHLAFAGRWGTINVNRFFTPVDGYPRIAEVRKEPTQEKNIGESWHTDHSYDQVPALGSILYARETPPAGGDTSFASQYAAYDSLSDGLKSTLLTLRATHSSRHAFGRVGSGKNPDAFTGRFNNAEAATQDAVHPMVIKHPLSGRPALYVNKDFTTGIEGWTNDEGDGLLRYLYAHASSDEFVTHFQWAVGSMAIWDNRATQHSAANDYAGHRRLMHRITLDGVPLEPFATT